MSTSLKYVIYFAVTNLLRAVPYTVFFAIAYVIITYVFQYAEKTLDVQSFTDTNGQPSWEATFFVAALNFTLVWIVVDTVLSRFWAGWREKLTIRQMPRIARSTGRTAEEGIMHVRTAEKYRVPFSGFLLLVLVNYFWGERFRLLWEAHIVSGPPWIGSLLIVSFFGVFFGVVIVSSYRHNHPQYPRF